MDPKKDDKKTPELDYDKDVHAPSMEDIASEMEDPEKVEEPVKEEKKIEEPVNPPEEKPAEKVEEKKEDKSIIDEEAFTDKIAEKVINKIAPEDATKEEKKDLRTALKELEAEREKEGKTLTYDEALEYLSQRTKEDLKAELKDEVKQEVLQDLAKEVKDEEEKEAKTAADQKKYEEDTTKAWNDRWDLELSELEDAGKITKVLNEADPEDAGKKERVALFGTMKAVNEDRAKKNLPPVLNLVQIHALYYQNPNEAPPGAKEPVAGSRKAVTPTNTDDINYDEIHGKSFDQIARGE